MKIAPFIVTLGSMSILRGVAKGVANEQKIDVQPARARRAPLPACRGRPSAGVWIAVASPSSSPPSSAYTRFGRHVFAVGSNEATARLCGVDVDWSASAVYTTAGLLAGIAGVMEFLDADRR